MPATSRNSSLRPPARAERAVWGPAARSAARTATRSAVFVRGQPTHLWSWRGRFRGVRCAMPRDAWRFVVPGGAALSVLVGCGGEVRSTSIDAGTVRAAHDGGSFADGALLDRSAGPAV